MQPPPEVVVPRSEDPGAPRARPARKGRARREAPRVVAQSAAEVPRRDAVPAPAVLNPGTSSPNPFRSDNHLPSLQAPPHSPHPFSTGSASSHRKLGERADLLRVNPGSLSLCRPSPAPLVVGSQVPHPQDRPSAPGLSGRVWDEGQVRKDSRPQTPYPSLPNLCRGSLSRIVPNRPPSPPSRRWWVSNALKWREETRNYRPLPATLLL